MTAITEVCAALGIARLELPIPFREAGGAVNVYLIEEEDGSLALFDTGTGTEESLRKLEEGLATLGRTIEDVRRVIISHGHVDHYGAARFIKERSSAAVFVHPADADKVCRGPGRKDFERYGAHLLRLGVPLEDLLRLSAAYRGHRSLGQRVEAVLPLEPGQELRFRRCVGRVVGMPGHTPGLVGLYFPEQRVLMSSDHLLARISPNPLLELGSETDEARDAGGGHFRALVTYLDSITRTYEMDVDLVLPGHGPAFTDHRRVIEGLRTFYEARQHKMLSALRDAPLSPYELVRRLFPDHERQDIFLMISEVVGNLEVLERRGAVQRLDGEPWRYRALKSA